MHINSIKKISFGWFFISLSLPLNTTNKDKSSANREKLAGNNKKGKLEDKSSANRKELANNNGEN